MAARKTSHKQEPQLLRMPAQKMAVVTTMGDPGKIAGDVLPSLYGSVYTLKFDLKKKGKDFKVCGLRARWPNAHLVPKQEWIGIWGLPIPNDVRSLPQKDPRVTVRIEKWQYGRVAQVLHLGPYSEERPTIERLHAFIEGNGYEIAGDHEEEYLTRPTAKVPKTLIRYPVKKRKR